MEYLYNIENIKFFPKSNADLMSNNNRSIINQTPYTRQNLLVQGQHPLRFDFAREYIPVISLVVSKFLIVNLIDESSSVISLLQIVLKF